MNFLGWLRWEVGATGSVVECAGGTAAAWIVFQTQPFESVQLTIKPVGRRLGGALAAASTRLSSCTCPARRNFNDSSLRFDIEFASGCNRCLPFVTPVFPPNKASTQTCVSPRCCCDTRSLVTFLSPHCRASS